MKTSTSSQDFPGFTIPQIEEWEKHLRLNTSGGDLEFSSSEKSACFYVNQDLKASFWFTFPISNFDDQKYRVKSALKCQIEHDGNYFTASLEELNLHASSKSPMDAIEDLKCVILDTFDRLADKSESDLGPHPKMQRKKLLQYIERK